MSTDFSRALVRQTAQAMKPALRAIGNRKDLRDLHQGQVRVLPGAVVEVDLLDYSGRAFKVAVYKPSTKRVSTRLVRH